MKLILLTKQQKLEAYTYALLCAHSVADDSSGSIPEMYFVKLISHHPWYVCHNLGAWYCENFGYISMFLDGHQVFPEFFMQKPDHSRLVWWPTPNQSKIGHSLRIAAIEAAINLTEQL